VALPAQVEPLTLATKRGRIELLHLLLEARPGLVPLPHRLGSRSPSQCSVRRTAAADGSE
jgi:hypothetical protein